MSADDLERWEARWRDVAAAGEPRPPEPFLARAASELPPGPVLDVAAGDGRNPLWLAATGREVTAVDVAPAAVERLAHSAARRRLPVTARVADLDEPEALAGLGPFAALVVVRYRPPSGQWPHLLAALRPGGRLLLCSFGVERHSRDGFPLAYCLDREALERELAPGLLLLRWEEFEEGSTPLAGSVWERRP